MGILGVDPACSTAPTRWGRHLVSDSTWLTMKVSDGGKIVSRHTATFRMPSTISRLRRGPTSGLPRARRTPRARASSRPSPARPPAPDRVRSGTELPGLVKGGDGTVEVVVGEDAGERPRQRAVVAPRDHGQACGEVLEELHRAAPSVLVGRCQREEPDPVLGQDPGDVPVVDRAQEADVGRKGWRIIRDGAADRERLSGGQPRQRAHGVPAEPRVEGAHVDGTGPAPPTGRRGEPPEVHAVLDHDHWRLGSELQAPQDFVRRRGDAVDDAQEATLHRLGVPCVRVGRAVDGGPAESADPGMSHQRLIDEGEARGVEALLAQQAPEIAGRVEAGGQDGPGDGVAHTEVVHPHGPGRRVAAARVARRGPEAGGPARTGSTRAGRRTRRSRTAAPGGGCPP